MTHRDVIHQEEKRQSFPFNSYFYLVFSFEFADDVIVHHVYVITCRRAQRLAVMVLRLRRQPNEEEEQEEVAQEVLQNSKKKNALFLFLRKELLIRFVC